jgi:DNA-binding response OmpR family regulator
MRVLLMEHDESLCERVRRVLRARGLQVVVVGEGAEAIELLGKCIFDLIITSLMAGTMRVVEFAIAAKGIQPRTPILVTGGYLGPNPTIPFIDAIVQEPVLLREVEQVATALLGSADARRCLRQPSYLRRGKRPARRARKSPAGT